MSIVRWMSAFALVSATGLLAADPSDAWPQFRGPEGRAVVRVPGGLPETFGPSDNLRWKAELPGRGLSCPVIADGKVFVTANSGMDQTRLHVLAFDLASGKQLWERQFFATGQTLCHPKTCMACPTVATDGKQLFALFATGDLAALNSDGDVLWVRSLCGDHPKMTNHVGRSSSPIIAGDVVAVLMENQGESFLFGIDRATGNDRWKAQRPMQNNWNTPMVVKRGGATEIVVSSYDDIAGYDAATGAKRWSHSEKGLMPVASPIAAGDMILVPGRQLLAVKPDGDKAVIVWKAKELGADTPTPLVHDGKIYAMSRNILRCGELSSGKQLWDLRVNGPFSASPILADGKLYLANEDGKVIVVQIAPEPKIIATNDLKDTLLATPAVADGALFFRSDKTLWCFAGGRKSS